MTPHGLMSNTISFNVIFSLYWVPSSQCSIGSLCLCKASEEELKAARRGKPASARPTANAKSRPTKPDSLALAIPKKDSPPKKGAEPNKGSEPKKDLQAKKSAVAKKESQRTQLVPARSPQSTETSTPSSSPSVSHPIKRHRHKSPEETPPAGRRNTKGDKAEESDEVPSLWVEGCS